VAFIQRSTVYLSHLNEMNTCSRYEIPFSIVCCSANTHAVKSKRKTLTGSDVLAAMEDMEFSQFVPALQDAVDG
jgi:hypothetical protein